MWDRILQNNIEHILHADNIITFPTCIAAIFAEHFAKISSSTKYDSTLQTYKEEVEKTK